jgi:hypothetical protein
MALAFFPRKNWINRAAILKYQDPACHTVSIDTGKESILDDEP